VKRRWQVLVAVAAGAGLWFGLPALGRRIEFFRVRRVEFVGLRYGAPGPALDSLRLPERITVFDDLDPIAERALRIPGVTAARAERRLPGTLVLHVTERRPVAVVPVRGQLAYMDSAGRVLPYDPSRAPADLPVADSADAGTGRLLGRVLRSAPGLFGAITEARSVDGDVMLIVEGRRYLFRPDATLEEMRAVQAVAADLVRKGAYFSELDGRYPGTVVVRGMDA
jgi:hypothetical protein